MCLTPVYFCVLIDHRLILLDRLERMARPIVLRRDASRAEALVNAWRDFLDPMRPAA
jgi:hypothetical protein